MAFFSFIIASAGPLLLMAFAFIATRSHSPRARQIQTASLVVAALYVWWGTGVLELRGLASLNPWLNADSAVVAILCIVVIVGNLIVAFPSRRAHLLTILGTICFVLVQWLGTAGRSIYYDHDPLPHGAERVVIFTDHYLGWGDRLIYSELPIPPHAELMKGEPLEAEVRTLGSERISVTTSLSNRDPRFNRSNRSRVAPEWTYRCPFQPSHKLVTVVDAGELLADNWQADDRLLLKAASNRYSHLWIRFLVKHGADPNYADGGLSPLSVAMTRGDPGTAMLLGELGADPNVDLGNGNRLLHLATREASYNDQWKPETLLRLGADVSIRNDEGLTAADLLEAQLITEFGTSSNPDFRNRDTRKAWKSVLNGWSCVKSTQQAAVPQFCTR